MFDREARILKTMQGYGDALLSDVEPDQMCLQPTPGSNHAAWIIGHLAFAADAHSRYAGATPILADWEPRFGMGSELSTDPGSYPHKDDLIQAWHDANDRLVAAAQGASDETLGQTTLGPLVETLPTYADFLAFSMTGHTATHLGQLSAWRRAIGRPRLF